nr:immunoglobulin heavy chain junction region [Mus musculus]
CTGYCGSRDYW